MVVELKIVGMSCEHCTGRVEKALGSIAGVTAVEVSLDPGSATVTGENIRLDDLVEALTGMGFDRGESLKAVREARKNISSELNREEALAILLVSHQLDVTRSSVREVVWVADGEGRAVDKAELLRP